MSVPAIVLLAVAIAAQGCGSGGATESSRERTSAPSQSAPEHPSAEATAPRRSAAPAPEHSSRASQGRQRPADATRPSRAPQSTPAKQNAGNASGGDVSCPPSYSRAQCAADAASGAKHTPSYAVSRPRDCLRAMSRAECKKMIEAEREAAESGGESFRPEDCLDHHTREECEAIFEAMGQAPK